MRRRSEQACCTSAAPLLGLGSPHTGGTTACASRHHKQLCAQPLQQRHNTSQSSSEALHVVCRLTCTRKTAMKAHPRGRRASHPAPLPGSLRTPRLTRVPQDKWSIKLPAPKKHEHWPHSALTCRTIQHMQKRQRLFRQHLPQSRAAITLPRAAPTSASHAAAPRHPQNVSKHESAGPFEMAKRHQTATSSSSLSFSSSSAWPPSLKIQNRTPSPKW